MEIHYFLYNFAFQLQNCIENVYQTYHFWRNNNDKEIDILWENGTELIPIEIKSGEIFSVDYFKTISHLSSLLPFSPDKKYVIYGGNASFNTL